MRLALLGADEDSLSLARSARDAGHTLVWQGDLSAAGAQRPAWLRDEDLASSWEALVDPESADAVLIGCGQEDAQQHARELQQLVRWGRPSLTTFPLFPSVLAYHEIALAHGDGRAPLQHFNPLLEHPLLESLCHWAQVGHPSGGRAEQLICERFLVDRSQSSVLWRFARDGELLDRISGRIDRVGAHGADHNALAYAGLSVQLIGPLKTPITWTPLPPSGDVAMRLTLVFPSGRVVVEFGSGDRPTCVRTLIDGNHDAESLEPGDAARRCVDRFVDAVQRRGEAASPPSDWTSALHAMELTDSIEISLRRGRMIDIQSQHLTEELAFRGTMSAVGCALLLALPPLLTLTGWVAGALGVDAADYWPHALLALLSVFLAFQLLPKLLLREPADASSDEQAELETPS